MSGESAHSRRNPVILPGGSWTGAIYGALALHMTRCRLSLVSQFSVAPSFIVLNIERIKSGILGAEQSGNVYLWVEVQVLTLFVLQACV